MYVRKKEILVVFAVSYHGVSSHPGNHNLTQKRKEYIYESDAAIDDLTVHVGVSKNGPEAGLDVSFDGKSKDWKIVAIAHNVAL